MQLKMRFNLISKINLLATVLIVLTSSGIAAFSIWGENKHMTRRHESPLRVDVFHDRRQL